MKTHVTVETVTNGHDSITYRFIVLSSQVDGQEDEDEKELVYSEKK